MDLEGKIGAAFGSYGWSGEAIEVIQDYLNKQIWKFKAHHMLLKQQE